MTPIKDPDESVVIDFDFSSELSAVDSSTISISVHSDGTDPDVAAMLDGAAQISGTSVLQRVKAGLDGLNYKLRCVAVSGSDIIVRADVMPVRTA